MKSAKKVYAGISALPPELIELIVRDLSSSDLHKCTITNLEWHQAFNPYLWRHIRIKVPTSKGVLHAPFIRFKSAVERGAMINIGDMVETLEAGYYDILELLDSDAMVAALERCDNDDKKNDPETNNKNDLETDNKINKDDTGKQTLQSAVRTYKPVCTRLRRLHVGSGIDPACVTTANITAFPVKQTYSGKTITRYQSSAPSPPSTAHGMPIYPTPDVPWNAAPFVFTPLTYPPPITTAFAEPIFSETPVLAVSAASLTTAPALAPASTTITTTPTASQFATAPISPAATEPSFATISSFDAAVAAGIPISGFGSTSTTTSPSHFGAAHTTPASGSTTITASTFGTAPIATTTSVPAFGATNTTTGPFGGVPSTTTISPFGPFPSTTTSAFGVTPSTSTSSAFGVTPSTSTTSAFGVTSSTISTSPFDPFPSSTTTSPFGVTPATTTTSPFGPFPSTTTSAFGVTPSTSTTSAFGVTPSTSTTSAFGVTPSTSTISAFGVTSSTISTSPFGPFPSSTATNSFGVTPSVAATTTSPFGPFPSSTTTSAFGVTPSVAATTTSLFGPFPSSTTTGAFGVTHSVTTTTASPFGPFSSSTATNAFEVTPSTITTSGFGVASTSLFGRTPTNTTTTRAFGVASTSLFGTDPSTTATASAFGVTPSSTTTGLFGDLPRSTIISLLRTPSTTSSAYDLDLSPLISLLRQNNQLQMLSLQGRLLDPSAAVIGDLADVFAALPASLESLRLNGFRGMKLFCDVIPSTNQSISLHQTHSLWPQPLPWPLLRLQTLPFLRTICIVSCRFSTNHLVQLFKRCPNLQALRLTSFNPNGIPFSVATALRDSCHRLNELCLSGHLNSDTNISQMISVSTCGWVTLSIPVLTPYGFETHTTSNYAQRENYFGIESTTALLKHASTLENLCLEGAMGFRSQDIHQLLCSAPRLKRLRLVSEGNSNAYAPKLEFHDILYYPGLSRQWVCQSLEYFACELDGLPRPDLQERAMVNPLLPGLELDLERSYQAHRKIYSRFAQLTCLKVLIFGPSEGRHLFGSKGLPMSLESGLDLLVNLKELEYVECDRVTSKFLNFEVQAWANANWPKYSQGPSAAREFWQRGGYYDDGTGTVQDPFSGDFLFNGRK